MVTHLELGIKTTASNPGILVFRQFLRNGQIIHINLKSEPLCKTITPHSSIHPTKTWWVSGGDEHFSATQGYPRRLKEAQTDG